MLKDILLTTARLVNTEISGDEIIQLFCMIETDLREIPPTDLKSLEALARKNASMINMHPEYRLRCLWRLMEQVRKKEQAQQIYAKKIAQKHQLERCAQEVFQFLKNASTSNQEVDEQKSE